MEIVSPTCYIAWIVVLFFNLWLVLEIVMNLLSDQKSVRSLLLSDHLEVDFDENGWFWDRIPQKLLCRNARECRLFRKSCSKEAVHWASIDLMKHNHLLSLMLQTKGGGNFEHRECSRNKTHFLQDRYLSLKHFNCNHSNHSNLWQEWKNNITTTIKCNMGNNKKRLWIMMVWVGAINFVLYVWNFFNCWIRDHVYIIITLLRASFSYEH